VFAPFSGPDAIVRLPAMPLLVAAGFGFVALALFLAGARRAAAEQRDEAPAADPA
jgi:DHA1 family tetracycline resistance protein-like MFS transporter